MIEPQIQGESLIGVLDTLKRIMAVVLQKPVAKNSLRAILHNIDAQNAPALIRELLWADPELTFALAAALPRLANTFILAAEELTVQVDRFPPDLIRRFATLMRDDIDLAALERTLANLKALQDELAPVLADFKRRPSP